MNTVNNMNTMNTVNNMNTVNSITPIEYQYYVLSTIPNNKYEWNKNHEICNLKHVWKDIQWKDVFNIINLKLDVIGNNIISYWSLNQVKDIYNILSNLNNNPENFISGIDYEEINEKRLKIEYLRKDIYILQKYFENYVKNKCIIKIL